MKSASSRERLHLLLLAGVWSLFMVLGILLGRDLVDKTHDHIMLREARAHFDKDQAFRRWAAMHGGVYVPITENTQPNPHLSHVPERDITTPLGRELTLMNPAYMQRQLHERFNDLYRVKGHITSLNPLRPENAPDEWERQTLEAFENGATERVEMVDIDGVPHLRLMRRMMTMATCLKCHGAQGYRIGDVRGGVSVAVNAAPHLADKRQTTQALVVNGSLIWGLGVGVIAWFGMRAARRTEERDQALHTLMRTNQALRTISECNEILVTSTNERELMDRVCRGIVESGGYHFAWVGVAEDDEAHTVRPVAYAGRSATFLDGLSVAWDDSSAGQCPTADAIRTGETRTFNLLELPAPDSPWCKRALEFGYKSTAAFPLRGGGCVFGALTIFSEDPTAFGPDEMTLLEELSQDLAFGVTALRTSKELDKTMLGLESARSSFNTLFATAKDAVFILSRRHIVDCNASAEQLLGAPRDAILTSSPTRFLPLASDGGKHKLNLEELFEAVIDKGEARTLECRLLTIAGKELFAEVGVNRIKLESGVFLQAVVRDVTERTETMRALQHSQHRLAEAQRIAAIGDWEWDVEHGRLTWSDEVYRIFGIAPGEFDETYDSFLKMVHPDDRERVDSATREALRRNKLYDMRHRILHPKGIRHVHERAEPQLLTGKTPSVLAGTVQDVTEQVTAQQAIIDLHHRSDLILRSAKDGIFGLDEDGRITFANPTGAAMLGHSEHILIGTPLCAYAGEEGAPHAKEDCPIHATLEDGISRHGRQAFRQADGSFFPADYTIGLLRDEEGIAGAVAALRDVTGEVEAQERQARDLREKDTLLKEIHHRVKNNMQIISSLLSLQSNELHDERDRELLHESMDRVRSMAIVHESLYHSGDLSSVDFARYVMEVGERLHGIYATPGTPVELDNKLEEVKLDITKAVPCGLIINELLTNALKHAFPRGEEGRITLTLDASNDFVRVQVADNGIGIDPSILEKEDTFGLSLVRNLASQLGGTLTVHSDGGTYFTLEIPKS